MGSYSRWPILQHAQQHKYRHDDSENAEFFRLNKPKHRGQYGQRYKLRGDLRRDHMARTTPQGAIDVFDRGFVHGSGACLVGGA